MCTYGMHATCFCVAQGDVPGIQSVERPHPRFDWRIGEPYVSALYWRCVVCGTKVDSVRVTMSSLKAGAGNAIRRIAGAMGLLVLATVGYLSIYHIMPLQFSCCDLSVREKDWRSRARGAKAT